MKHDLITPPASEPITVNDAKAYLRVTHSSEDNLIAAEITAARKLCENATRMSFIEQGRRSIYRLPKFSWDFEYNLRNRTFDTDKINSRIYLARGPVVSVESLRVFHSEAVSTVLDVERYAFIPGLGTIEWEPDALTDYLENNDFLEVNYTAGLPDSDAFVAAYPDLAEAIRMCVSVMYDQRGFTLQSLPPAIAPLIAPYWSSPTYR